MPNDLACKAMTFQDAYSLMQIMMQLRGAFILTNNKYPTTMKHAYRKRVLETQASEIK